MQYQNIALRLVAFLFFTLYSFTLLAQTDTVSLESLLREAVVKAKLPAVARQALVV